MQWENLTVGDFEAAVRETGVCVLAMGVLEKHSEHLPLGTDFLIGHEIACMATEKEPAVVFPPFYFGQIYEAKCFPGTLTIRPTLLLELLQAVLDDIGRNGFKKIIIYNSHGGNSALVNFLAQCSLWEEKPYSIYCFSAMGMPDEERKKKWDSILETSFHGHACECETSVSLANHPNLVKMDRIPEEPAISLGRMDHLKGNSSGIGWYARFPDHYAGDARTASREKGEKLRDLMVDSLAEFIAAVKKDVIAPELEKEFFERQKAEEFSDQENK